MYKISYGSCMYMYRYIYIYVLYVCIHILGPPQDCMTPHDEGQFFWVEDAWPGRWSSSLVRWIFKINGLGFSQQGLILLSFILRWNSAAAAVMTLIQVAGSARSTLHTSCLRNTPGETTSGSLTRQTLQWKSLHIHHFLEMILPGNMGLLRCHVWLPEASPASLKQWCSLKLSSPRKVGNCCLAPKQLLLVNVHPSHCTILL